MSAVDSEERSDEEIDIEDSRASTPSTAEKTTPQSEHSSPRDGTPSRLGKPSPLAIIKPYPPPPRYSELMSLYTPQPIPAIIPHTFVYIPVINPFDGRCYYQPVPRDRLAPLPTASLPAYSSSSIASASSPAIQ